MGEKYIGLYRAKCIDNNDPRGMGRILVHIYQINGALNYDPNVHSWCPVLSQYGGLSGMGLMMLPPLHADGFVIFENGNDRSPVWIGSYPFSAKKTINEEASQSAGYPVVETIPSVPVESANDPTTVVLKTQYPSASNPNTESNDNAVENIVVMSEEKMEFLHKNQIDYKYEPFGINSSTSSSSYLTLRDGAVILGVRASDGRRQEIIIDDSGITLKSSRGDEISVKEGFINIIGSDRCQINIKALENGSININGKTLKMDGETMVIGPPGDNGGAGSITADCICPFTNLKTHVGSTKTIIGG